MNDPFNKHIYEKQLITNSEGSNYILDEIQSKNIDNEFIELKSNSQGTGANTTVTATSSLGGTIPAVVTLIATITVITAVLMNAPKVDLNYIEVLTDRVKLEMTLEETDNPYILELYGEDYEYYEEFSDKYYERTIIGLDGNKTYELTIKNDYGTGETVLKKVIFDTPNDNLNVNKGKIIIKDFEILSDDLIININIDDPNNYLYDFKILIINNNQNIEYKLDSLKDIFKLNISELEDGLFTIKIYSKSNFYKDDNDKYYLKTTYKGRK